MSDAIDFLPHIGKYIGAAFLEARRLNPVVAPMLEIDPTSLPDGNRVMFKMYDTPLSRPVLAAFYQLPDGSVQLQAVGHGGPGESLWLGKGASSSLCFINSPFSLTMSTSTDGYLGFSYTSGGITYEACAYRLHARVPDIVYPIWHWNGPFLSMVPMSVKKRPISPNFPHPYRGPFPSPEELRSGVRAPGLNFFNMFLVNVDLTGAHLPEAVFKEVQFYNTTFNGATLTGADFRHCLLGRAGGPCSFAGAKLASAGFAEADLTGVDFTGADLVRAYFYRANLTGANFTGANLFGAVFEEANLTGANFTGADLTDAVFQGATLTGVNFSGAKLSKSIDFSRINLTGANFTGTDLVHAHFENATLTGTNFTGANLSYAHFENDTLTGVNFTGANLSHTFFQGATLTGVNFSGATIKDVVFVNHNLTGANLSGAKLDESINFYGANMTRVNLTNTSLYKLKLGEINLTGAILTGATLDQTDLRRALLQGVNLSSLDLRTTRLQDARLPGANLSGADLRGTDLTGADLSEVAVCTTRPLTSRDVSKRTNFTDAKLHYGVLKLDWEFVDLTRVQLFGVPVVEDTTNYDLAGLKAQSAILTQMNLNKADLTEAQLMRAQLQYVNLAGAALDFADLTGAVLKNTNLTRATMLNANLTDTDLTYAEMSYVALYGDSAKVNGASMVLTNLANAYLVGLDFAGIKGKSIQGCTFTGACLANTDFRQTEVSRYDSKPTSMAGACLQGADFTGASLYGVNLVNAAVAKQAGELEVTLAGTTNTLGYQPTKLDAGITDQATTCPCNDLGPCTPAKMESANAPMHQWPSHLAADLLGLPDPTDDEVPATTPAAD